MVAPDSKQWDSVVDLGVPPQPSTCLAAAPSLEATQKCSLTVRCIPELPSHNAGAVPCRILVWPGAPQTYALTDSGFRDLGEEACTLACGDASSPRSCTNRRFKDGRAAFPQKWRCGDRQGWNADWQRVGTRLGVRRTGRPPGPAPYSRCEDSGAI